MRSFTKNRSQQSAQKLIVAMLITVGSLGNIYTTQAAEAQAAEVKERAEKVTYQGRRISPKLRGAYDYLLEGPLAVEPLAGMFAESALTLTPEEQRDLNRQLYFAVLSRDADSVVTLVNEGADINYIGPGGSFGRTPLGTAIDHGSPCMVEVLLNAGADVNARDGGGFTALVRALQGVRAQFRADPVIVQLLIDAGANLILHGGESVLDLARWCKMQARDKGRDASELSKYDEIITMLQNAKDARIREQARRLSGD
jgi:hypothetical protein